MPQRLRREVRRLRGRGEAALWGPRVTVVVVAGPGDADHLQEALDSVRAQTHRNLDILVSIRGDGDDLHAVARRCAREDWRVRVRRAPRETRAEARNRAAERATGTYLLFLSAEDELPAGGVRDLVASLEASGSDFAVGSQGAALTMQRSVLPPFDPAHAEAHVRVRLADFPLAVTDLAEGNRAFRRSFWRRAALGYEEEDLDGADLALTSYLRASAFDVVPDVTHVRMGRNRGVPVGHATDMTLHLDTWLASQRRALDRLAGSSPEVRICWAYGVLEITTVPYLDDIERMDAGQFTTLAEHVKVLLGDERDEIWSMVRAETRLKLWLLVQGRRTELEELVTARFREQGNRPTVVSAGRVYAVLPFWRDATLGIPDWVFRMRKSETGLHVLFRGLRWVDGATIELDLFAWIDFVGHLGPPQVEVYLVDSAGLQRIPLRVRCFTHPDVNMLVGHRYQDYSQGALTVTVDATLLGAGLEPTDDAEWLLEVQMSAQGVTRSGTIDRIDERGSAGLLGWPHLAPRLVGSSLVGVAAQGSRVRVVARPAGHLGLTDVSVVDRTVRGRLLVRTLDVIALHAESADGRVSTSCRLVGPDDQTFVLKLPRNEDFMAWVSPRFWRLEVESRDGSRHPVAWTDDAPDPWHGIGANVVLRRNPQGNCELFEAADTLIVDSLELEPGFVVLNGRWLGSAPRTVRLGLRGRRAHLVGELRSAPGSDTLVARFSTRWDEWGLGETAVPPGQYHVELTCGPADRPRQGRTALGAALVERLLTFTVDADFRFRPARIGRDAGIRLQPPLSDQDRGAYMQTQLQLGVSVAAEPMREDVVYLQAYVGASATDSQLALHRELRRVRPDLTLLWGVRDPSSWVPEGGTPLLMYSREWYHALSTSKYLVNNIDFDRWFRKRPEQKFLQTFHGYPSKSMGLRIWTAKNHTPRRIALELERTSGDWDLILTPTPEMDVYYRENYRYDGPILNQGYPRDDVLVGPGADEVRRRTRTLLDIAEHQTTVLYAPTWRDHLATNWRSAPLVEHLDLEEASKALGPEYVILMRGHRFHAQGAERSERTARIIDVTDYPEINDLILAADTAVLDYSSLRFDFALTRRPMLFLVPDLDMYSGGVRGFLYDYHDTAPGPMLDSAGEVIDRLKDLARVRETYADAYERFNATYNYLMDGHSAERVVNEFFGPAPSAASANTLRS